MPRLALSRSVPLARVPLVPRVPPASIVLRMPRLRRQAPDRRAARHGPARHGLAREQPARRECSRPPIARGESSTHRIRRDCPAPPPPSTAPWCGSREPAGSSARQKSRADCERPFLYPPTFPPCHGIHPSISHHVVEMSVRHTILHIVSLPAAFFRCLHQCAPIALSSEVTMAKHTFTLFLLKDNISSVEDIFTNNAVERITSGRVAISRNPDYAEDATLYVFQNEPRPPR